MGKLLNTGAGAAIALVVILLFIPLLHCSLSIKLMVYSVDFKYASFIVLLPVLFVILLIEMAFIAAAKIKKVNTTTVLIFQIVLIGYLFFFVFHIVYGIIVKSASGNQFLLYLMQSGYSYMYQLVFILVISLVILSYINLFLKRMKKSIPTVIEHKAGKIK